MAEESLAEFDLETVSQEGAEAGVSFDDFDFGKLNPLSPVVINRQATINIGTIGHVAHGKSTVVKSISGVKTVKYKSELERNITIKLGYANAKVFKCKNPKCEPPGCYKSYGSGIIDPPTCEVSGCGGKMELLRCVFLLFIFFLFSSIHSCPCLFINVFYHSFFLLFLLCIDMYILVCR